MDEILNGSGYYVGFETYNKLIKQGYEFSKIDENLLNSGKMPERFKRNMLSPKEQLKLHNASAVVLGCGGLGGYVLSLLARLGIRNLTIVDYDRFDESNLNRQLFSSYENLGELKAKVVAKELLKINPALNLNIITSKLESRNFDDLKESGVWIDALDDISLKLEISHFCKVNNIDFIHAAVGGMSCQAGINYDLSKVYKNSQKGAEKTDGNLSHVVARCASMQVGLALNLLLFGENEPKFIFCDTKSDEIYHF